MRDEGSPYAAWIVGLLLCAGAVFLVLRVNGEQAAALLCLWFPVIYSLVALTSGRRRLIESLRESPMFLAFSRVFGYETGFGPRRLFQFDEARVREVAELADKTTYFFRIGSGTGYFSGDNLGQQLDFELGMRTNLMEIPPEAVRSIKDWCREYDKARNGFHAFVVLGSAVAIVIAATQSPSFSFALLCLATLALAYFGFAPRVESRPG